MREMICIVLSSILFLHSGLEAKAGVPGAASPTQAESKAKPTFKERILEIPPGSMIEVRLVTKEKVRGRLGEVSNEGFSLQTAKGNNIETRKIAFEDLKSIKKVEGKKAAKTAGYVTLGVLAGLGAVLLIIIIALAARAD
jgi:hypothetical protein